MRRTWDRSVRLGFGHYQPAGLAHGHSLTRTSRHQRGDRDRWRMRRVEAANPSLTVGAPRLGGGGLLAFGESGDSLRLWGVGPQHFLLRDRGLLTFFWMSNCI